MERLLHPFGDTRWSGQTFDFKSSCWNAGRGAGWRGTGAGRDGGGQGRHPRPARRSAGPGAARGPGAVERREARDAWEAGRARRAGRGNGRGDLTGRGRVRELLVCVLFARVIRFGSTVDGVCRPLEECVTIEKSALLCYDYHSASPFWPAL